MLCGAFWRSPGRLRVDDPGGGRTKRAPSGRETGWGFGKPVDEQASNGTSAATYSPTASRSTIGAEGLNCWVRDGTRCVPLARATDIFDFRVVSRLIVTARRSLPATYPWIRYASVAVASRCSIRDTLLFVKARIFVVPVDRAGSHGHSGMRDQRRGREREYGWCQGVQ